VSAGPETATRARGRLRRIAHEIRRIGLVRAARIAWGRLFLTVIGRIYRLDPWHVRTPAAARPYRATVAEMVNALHPEVVVEVGCGLGYVLAPVRARQRYGYDVDGHVIRAARLLRGRRIAFIQGELSAVSQPRIDVLILVNWIHALSPAALEAALRPLLGRTRYLVLDAIDPDAPGSSYRHRHDFAFLDGQARHLLVAHAPNEARSFHLFEVVR
jgi:hypothetical protein